MCARKLVTGLYALAVFGVFAAPVIADPLSIKPNAAQKCRREVAPPIPRSVDPPDAAKVLAPPTGVYAGLYSIGTTVNDIDAFAAKTGKSPAIVFTFHDWVSDAEWAQSNPHLRTFSDPLEDPSTTPLALAASLAQNGRVLALAWALQCCDWESFTWWMGLRKTRITIERLLHGELDGYVRTVAGQVRDFGKPIMLTIFSEFNFQGAYAFGRVGTDSISSVDDLCGLYGDPAWPDGPERVRDAFMHVIDVFRAAGAHNVTWFMYAGSRYMDMSYDDSNKWLHPRYFYPGDAYIDWVGQSVYFVDPKWGFKVNADASTVVAALEPGYRAWGEVTQRPLYLPEFGALGDGKTSRAKVLRKVMKKYLPTLPRVRALTLADFQIAEICCQTPRLGITNANEVRAWKKVVSANPYYVHQPVIGVAKH